MADIRRNLDTLVYLADVVGPEYLVSYVRVELEELGELRSEMYIRPVTPEDDTTATTLTVETIIDITESVSAQSVKVRDPHRNEMPPSPGPSRKIPASNSYNPERYVPIKVLWAKVIIRAAYDYALWKDSKDMRLRTYAKDAERWLFETSGLELSFKNICEAFDFPLEKIRLKTRLLTKQDVKKLEFRERNGRIAELPGDTFGGIDE